jgi:hypothetical protein
LAGAPRASAFDLNRVEADTAPNHAASTRALAPLVFLQPGLAGERCIAGREVSGAAT